MTNSQKTSIRPAATGSRLRRAAGAAVLAVVTTLAACGGQPSGDAATGGVTYVKNFGVPGADHQVTASAALPDGGRALLGMLEMAGVSAESTAGAKKLVVTRIDAQGNLAWSRTYGSEPFVDQLALRALIDAAPAGDGGVFVAGQSAAGPVVAKYDAAWNLVGTQSYGSAPGAPGDLLADIAAIAPAPTGGYVVGGSKVRDAEGVPRRHAWLQYANSIGAPGPVSNDLDGVIYDSPQYMTSLFNYESIHDLVVTSGYRTAVRSGRRHARGRGRRAPRRSADAQRRLQPRCLGRRIPARRRQIDR